MTMLNGVATAGMKAPDGNFNLNTTLKSPDALTLSTILKNAFRALGTPLGGKMIF